MGHTVGIVFNTVAGFSYIDRVGHATKETSMLHVL